MRARNFSPNLRKCASAATAGKSPDRVVKELYANCMKNEGFDKEIVKTYKPWLAPELYKRIWKNALIPVAKGDAPDIDGDLFLDAQETPTKMEFGQSTIDKDKAKMPVTLHWDSEKRTLTVLLEQINGEWKVYDVIYGGTDGKLTDQLK